MNFEWSRKTVTNIIRLPRRLDHEEKPANEQWIDADDFSAIELVSKGSNTGWPKAVVHLKSGVSLYFEVEDGRNPINEFLQALKEANESE